MAGPFQHPVHQPLVVIHRLSRPRGIVAAEAHPDSARVQDARGRLPGRTSPIPDRTVGTGVPPVPALARRSATSRAKLSFWNRCLLRRRTMPRSSLSAAREQTSRSPSTLCTYVVRSYPTSLSVDAGRISFWCRPSGAGRTYPRPTSFPVSPDTYGLIPARTSPRVTTGPNDPYSEQSVHAGRGRTRSRCFLARLAAFRALAATPKRQRPVRDGGAGPCHTPPDGSLQRTCPTMKSHSAPPTTSRSIHLHRHSTGRPIRYRPYVPSAPATRDGPQSCHGGLRPRVFQSIEAHPTSPQKCLVHGATQRQGGN